MERFGSCHAASMMTLRQPTQRLPRFRRSGSVPADAQASLDWRPKDIALAARAIRNSWLFPRGRPAQRGGLPLFGFRKPALPKPLRDLYLSETATAQRWNQMSAHDEGFRAGKAGEPEQRCPYRREGIKRRDWRRGWERGRNSNKHISPDHEPNMPAKGQTRALAAR